MTSNARTSKRGSAVSCILSIKVLSIKVLIFQSGVGFWFTYLTALI